MDKEKIIEEVKDLSLDDLELIVSTQKDLYSPEEMEYIQELILQKKQEGQDKEQTLIRAHLPKEIPCLKCDGMNPSSNDKCCFCGCDLDKSRYFKVDSDDEGAE